MVKVFKFGGASIKDADGFRNVKQILERYRGQSAKLTDSVTSAEQLVIVVSALGKTTNALEEIAKAYYNNENAEPLFTALKKKHFDIVDQLFNNNRSHPIYTELNNVFVEIDWILEDEPAESFDYLYDQVISIGEMASTKILAAYLNESGLNVSWTDARDLIRTDNTYREGKIQWEYTERMVKQKVPAILENHWMLTQGFIGGTSENFTTTLGREGSDYTAAILAYCLDAESVTIWKDVPGVLNADPRYFPSAQKIDKLGYHEAIEMTYYGATVIHPKTIKPLQNKGIPLNVRSFIKPLDEGTVIAEAHESLLLPAVLVLKKNQILISIAAKDFSFIAEENLGYIFTLLSKYRLKSNMMQNAAISFSICVDNEPEKVKLLLEELSQSYHTLSNDKLELITVRHYTDAVLSSVTQRRAIVLEQKTRNTAQIILEEK